MALYKHCHLDDNCADVLEPRSDFAEFRTKAEESVKDVTFIIGSAELLKSVSKFFIIFRFKRSKLLKDNLMTKTDLTP